MRFRFQLLAVALALVGAAPASAQWTYDFSGTFDVGQGEAKTLAFTLTVPAPITIAESFTVTGCTVVAPTVLDRTFSCDMQQFDPNGFGTGNNFIGAGWSDFDANTNAPLGSATSFFFFDPGSFTTPGSYTRSTSVPPVANPLFVPGATCNDDNDDQCREFNFFGSAGDATLIVIGPGTEVVPEPATMTLLATGLVGMVAARRRRNGQES